ncbi:hypothetical protein B2J93_2130 [Marssonina coronariae]|uniref:Uncharacterized protein n=1 Tax=Diplocarpon coronariae TaxID=2795749 RepID=A0A218Z1Q7_9HELO|nr:hypothetical protein B2J93_2130 [Marssonina coronariae]
MQTSWNAAQPVARSPRPPNSHQQAQNNRIGMPEFQLLPSHLESETEFQIEAHVSGCPPCTRTEPSAKPYRSKHPKHQQSTSAITRRPDSPSGSEYLTRNETKSQKHMGTVSISSDIFEHRGGSSSSSSSSHCTAIKQMETRPRARYDVESDRSVCDPRSPDLPRRWGQ